VNEFRVYIFLFIPFIAPNYPKALDQNVCVAVGNGEEPETSREVAQGKHI